MSDLLHFIKYGLSDMQMVTFDLMIWVILLGSLALEILIISGWVKKWFKWWLNI